ncbi:unnamed protein product [Timema podura]|uniref:Uncharacterized protein n=1 Tax=Timema podura TaxID=61482 RepID=A0ABN7P343_TIMPD|nr:unnamed protein product [Timema podura]
MESPSQPLTTNVWQILPTNSPLSC